MQATTPTSAQMTEFFGTDNFGLYDLLELRDAEINAGNHGFANRITAYIDDVFCKEADISPADYIRLTR